MSNRYSGEQSEDKGYTKALSDGEHGDKVTNGKKVLLFLPNINRFVLYLHRKGNKKAPELWIQETFLPTTRGNQKGWLHSRLRSMIDLISWLEFGY